MSERCRYCGALVPPQRAKKKGAAGFFCSVEHEQRDKKTETQNEREWRAALDARLPR